MTLKFIAWINEHRNMILGVLILPLIALLFLGNFKLNLLPPYKYPQYDIKFYAPGTLASYLEKKVTSEAERIFNGLPGLISVESLTKHETAIVSLRFDKGLKSDTILLFIQEKMDRLKFILPGDVNRISIDENKRPKLPNITINNDKGLERDQLIEILSPYRDKIKKISPNLRSNNRLDIKLDILALKTNDISIDQVWKALRTNGISYELGQKDNINYFLKMDFKRIEDIESIVIGAKGDRPILLKDVSEFIYRPDKLFKKVSIWSDSKRMEWKKLKEIIKNKWPASSIESDNFILWTTILKKPILNFIILISMQLLFFYLLFRKIKALSSIIIFDVIWSIHYFFWIGITCDEITLIDITTYFIGLLVATFFWVVMLGRIRFYFRPVKLYPFIRRTLDQASIFSLAEYLPTFIILSAFLFVLSIPLVLSDINLISQEIIIRFFSYAFPITIILLVILPSLLSLDWLMTIETKGIKKDKQKFEKLVSPHYFWPIIALFILSITLWKYTPFGIIEPNFPNNNYLNEYRGYSSTLPYYQSSSLELSSELQINKKNSLKKEWLEVWEISTRGLSLLSDYNISLFQRSLSDIQQNHLWGNWNFNNFAIKLHFKAFNLQHENFSKLLVGPKNPKKHDPISLGLLLSPSFELVPSNIFRGQLEQVNQFSYPYNMTDGNFLHDRAYAFTKAPITRQWFEQHNMFVSNFWIILTFIFILSSLYLNSFFKGGLLTILSISVSFGVLGFKILTKSPLHLDGIWSFWLPTWMVLAVILFMSRIVDGDRLKGNERDLVLEEMEVYFAPVILGGVFFFSFGMIVFGVLDIIPWSLQTYFFKECIVTGSSTLIFGLLSYHFFFRLFYTSGDHFIESITFKLYKLYMRFVKP